MQLLFTILLFVYNCVPSESYFNSFFNALRMSDNKSFIEYTDEVYDFLNSPIETLGSCEQEIELEIELKKVVLVYYGYGTAKYYTENPNVSDAVLNVGLSYYQKRLFNAFCEATDGLLCSLDDFILLKETLESKG